MYRSFQRFEDLVHALGAGFAVFLFLQVLNPLSTFGLMSSNEASNLVSTQHYAACFRTDGRVFLIGKEQPVAHEISRETYSELRANGVSMLEGLDETVSITCSFLIAITLFIYRECRTSSILNSESDRNIHYSQAQLVQSIQIEEKLDNVCEWIEFTNYRLVRFIRHDYYS